MKHLKDASGIYNLDHVVSITPTTVGKKQVAILHMSGGTGHVTDTAYDDAVNQLTAEPVAAADKPA